MYMSEDFVKKDESRSQEEQEKQEIISTVTASLREGGYEEESITHLITEEIQPLCDKYSLESDTDVAIFNDQLKKIIANFEASAAVKEEEEYESFDTATVEEMKTKAQEMKEAYKEMAAEVGEDETKGKPTKVLRGEDLRAYRGFVQLLGKFAQRTERVSNQGSHAEGGYNATKREIEQVTSAYTTIQERAATVAGILEAYKGKNPEPITPEPDPDRDMEYQKRLVIRADWQAKKQIYEDVLKKFEAAPKDAEVLEELSEAEAIYREARGLYSQSLEYAFKDRALRKRGGGESFEDRADAINDGDVVMEEKLGSLLAERFVLEPTNQKLAAEKASLTNQERGTFENLFEKVRDGMDRHRGKIKIAGYGVLIGVAVFGGVAAIATFLVTKKIAALSAGVGAVAGGGAAGFLYQKLVANGTEKKLEKAVSALENTFSTKALDDMEADYYTNAKKFANADRNKRRAVTGGAVTGAFLGLAFSPDVTECAEALDDALEQLTPVPVPNIEMPEPVSPETQMDTSVDTPAPAESLVPEVPAPEMVESLPEVPAPEAPAVMEIVRTPAPEQVFSIPDGYEGTDTIEETLHEAWKSGRVVGLEGMTNQQFLDSLREATTLFRDNEKILELMSVDGQRPLSDIDLVFKGSEYNFQPYIDYMNGASISEIETGMSETSVPVSAEALTEGPSPVVQTEEVIDMRQSDEPSATADSAPQMRPEIHATSKDEILAMLSSEDRLSLFENSSIKNLGPLSGYAGSNLGYLFHAAEGASLKGLEVIDLRLTDALEIKNFQYGPNGEILNIFDIRGNAIILPGPATSGV